MANLLLKQAWANSAFWYLCAKKKCHYQTKWKPLGQSKMTHRSERKMGIPWHIEHTERGRKIEGDRWKRVCVYLKWIRQSPRRAIDAFGHGWTEFARTPIQIIIHVHLVCSNNYDNFPIVVDLYTNTYCSQVLCVHVHRTLVYIHRFVVALIPIPLFCNNNNEINLRRHSEILYLLYNRWHYESMI